MQTGERDLTSNDTAPPERPAGGPVPPTPENPPQVLERDLTVEENERLGETGGELEAQTPSAEPYSLTKAQERVRGRIAQWLVVLLSAVILASFLTMWFAASKIDDLEKLLTIIFGPIITLVGTAIGYYFGGKNGQDGSGGG